MKLPSMASLSAFECAARHCNFSRAAQELRTSQSAVSRHIADLETRLRTQLFFRERKTVRLTEQGEFLFAAVKTGLRTIRNATDTVSAWGHREHVTIACTHEISHLFVMPRFEQLQANAGDNVTLRVMTYEYDALEQVVDPRIDIVLTYDPGPSRGPGAVIIAPEAVRPVCDPTFHKRYASVLEQPGESWGSVPLLRLSKPNRGWATWDDWFEQAGGRPANPSFIDFDNYVYLLEAAAAGKGLALGWRGLVDRHLTDGSLVPVVEAEQHSDNALFALLTPRGQTIENAVTCVRNLAVL